MRNVFRIAAAALLTMPIPLPIPATGTAADAVAGNGTGFSLATPDGDFSLNIYGYGQARYTFTDHDGTTNQSNFAVQRARLGLTGNAFAGLQWRGLSARVERHRRRIAPVDPAQPEETAVGVTAQGGWFVIPGVLELAVRCELFNPDRGAGNDQVREHGLAIGRFWNGHRNKLQTDLFQVIAQAPGGTTEDNRLRARYQLAF